MKTLCLTLLFISIAGGCVLADDVPDPTLPSDNRIRVLKYSDEDVYTITTKYGYQTNIVFGKGEDIQTISVGDRSLWQLIPSGNRLFIRPMEDGVETNMTLITNKHSYQFEIKSLETGKTGNNIYVARFSYPDDETKHPAKPTGAPTLAQAAAQAQFSKPGFAENESAWSEPLHTAPARPAPTPMVAQPTPARPLPPTYPNYNYTYAGPDAVAPLQTYDDGKSTFIQYHDNQPLPAVYMIDAGGTAQPVSYYVENNRMVIGMVAGEWRLESDSGTVTLYNEMLNPK